MTAIPGQFDRSTSPPARRRSATPSGRRTERSVLIMVGLVLLTGEVIVNRLEDTMSRDVAMIRSFPHIARRLSDGHSTGHRTVLFFGKSLIREGIQTDVIERTLTDARHKPSVIEKATIDASGITEWYYGFKRDFLNRGVQPDVLVIGFEGRDGHLTDQRALKPELLGRFLCDRQDLPELLSTDLQRFDQGVDCLLARGSALYAHRTRIRHRVLAATIPSYRAFQDRAFKLPVTNSTLASGKPGEPPAATERLIPREQADPQPTYSRLQRLVERSRAGNVDVVLLAMPVPNAEPVDPDLMAFARRFGIAIVDVRDELSFPDDQFPDGLHMHSTAARVFSAAVASRLADLPVVDLHETEIDITFDP